MHRQAAVVGLALAAAAMLACSSSSNGGGTGPIGGHSTTITASSSTSGGAYGMGGNYFFSPTPDTVTAGTAVTFRFGSVVHNIRFDTGPAAIDSIPLASNTSTNRTFPTAGTYNFHCTIHNFAGVLIAQ
jgi:plastocyanin